ncbi:hypothetical protein ACVIIW_004478 [Bradyrhizobium sp. USDA 4449]
MDSEMRLSGARRAEADLEHGRQQQHDPERGEGAAKIVVEAACLIEDLGVVAGDADKVFAVGAEIDGTLDHAQVLPLGPVDVSETNAGCGELGALVFQLRQLLVPERA